MLRLLSRASLVSLTLAAAMITPTAVFAEDGEVGDVRDTDSITDIYESNNRPTVRADYVKDCPAGISNCIIEVQFRYKCPELWCVNWTTQGWKALTASTGVAQADCIGNDDNYWEVSYRVKWTAATTKTTEYWGETELYLDINGAWRSRLIPEALFNVTNNTGLRYGTKTETDTGTTQYSNPSLVATSAGNVLHTC